MSFDLASMRAPSAWVLALAVLALPHAGRAQGAPAPAANTAEPPGYREAIDDAIAEYTAGRYPEARALFARAHELQPSARTLRGLGMTEFELRHYVDATRMLEEALTSNVRPLDGELRKATEALLERSRTFVGRYVLSLTPATMQLIIDGAPPRIEADHSLSLSVGDHALHAQAEGYVAIDHTLRVTGGENTTLNITLQKVTEPVAAAVPPVATPPGKAQPAVTPTSPTEPRDEESSSVLSSPWFWTAAAVVVIGAGVGIGIVLLSDDAGTAAADGGSTGVVLAGP